jgi:hypothetical protein
MEKDSVLASKLPPTQPSTHAPLQHTITLPCPTLDLPSPPGPSYLAMVAGPSWGPVSTPPSHPHLPPPSTPTHQKLRPP